MPRSLLKLLEEKALLGWPKLALALNRNPARGVSRADERAIDLTIAFMAFLAIVLGERVSARLGAGLLLPLLVVGAATVWYWHVTERAGHGDLRPYILVQFLPILLIPLVVVLFPRRPADTRFIWVMLAAYALAKACEELDIRVFAATRLIGGHTLKHVVAAFGALAPVGALRQRRQRGDGS